MEQATSVRFLQGINQLVTQCLAPGYGAKFVRFGSCVIFICPVKIRLVLPREENKPSTKINDMAVVLPNLVHAKEGSPVFRPDLVITLVPAQNNSVHMW